MSEPRRIRPPKEFERLIDKLVDAGIFETKQAAMMFAAALGKRFTGRKPLGSPGEGIRWHIFEKAGDEAFVNSLALAEKEDINVLDPDAGEGEDVQTIFEEYAAGGFQYLKQHVAEATGDFLNNALAIIQQYQTAQQPSPPGLEGLDSSALELLGDLDR
ncbi:MAG: DNA phosphorothioation-associated protein 4 [Planctomycetes bacterium]|nr:DNA phosphorothioation-associated protein 4 [Planctomycetota bacterium]